VGRCSCGSASNIVSPPGISGLPRIRNEADHDARNSQEADAHCDQQDLQPPNACLLINTEIRQAEHDSATRSITRRRPLRHALMRVAAVANRSPSRRVPGARFAHTPSRAAQRGRTTIECGSMAWPGGGAPMRISTAGLLLVTAFILVGCVHETRVYTSTDGKTLFREGGFDAAAPPDPPASSWTRADERAPNR
jgi:hypothetical protein